ncbi:MAG: TRAPP subunit [Peltula sp. TS41687]|nr:MAG: TRAPP subunit [Peltula sp. TS41687]
MSYYFSILGSLDNPLFEHEFGTSKQGGDGLARFPESARHMNQFIVHGSLDIVEEVQWAAGDRQYLKVVDRFGGNYVSCFLTGGNIKFLLLHNPTPTSATMTTGTQPKSMAGMAGGGLVGSAATTGSTTTTTTTTTTSAGSSSSIATNPTAPQTEEAIRQFFTEVYEVWIKCLMNPFYAVEMPIVSPVFRQRVAAAGKKYL